jgi:deoxyxylulose-5-phosphate synthase
VPGSFALYVTSSVVFTDLKKRGYERAEEVLKGIHPSPTPYLHVGSTKEVAANRVQFGEAVADVLDKAPERKKDVFVIDSDLEGSTGLKVIHTRHPEVFQVRPPVVALYRQEPRTRP